MKIYLLELVPVNGPTSIVAVTRTDERAKVAAFHKAPGLVGDKWVQATGHEWTQRKGQQDRLTITGFEVLE